MESLLSGQELSQLSYLNPNVRKGTLAKSGKRRAELARLVTALLDTVMRTVVSTYEDRIAMFKEVAKSSKGKIVFGLDSTATDSDRYECMQNVAVVFQVNVTIA